MKLRSLKIKDELQGSSQYLACSFLSDQCSITHLRNLKPADEEFQMMEEDDIFKDALCDFLSLPDSLENMTPDKDQRKGRNISDDVFYEAQGSDDPNFVSLVFLTRTPTSPDYDGIDTQVRR